MKGNINKLINMLTPSARQTRSTPNRRRSGKTSVTPTVNNGRFNSLLAIPNNQEWGRSMPAAYASHVRPRFNILSRNGDSVRVAGCDLVYALPQAIISEDIALFSVIPSNPAYWGGTRVAQFAPAYMNYRPVSMTFSYIPQVAVTQPGTVIMGTLWNGASGDEDLQQTLFTSNGGCMTQCYVPADTAVKLGNNLQQNLFTLSGAISPDTSPFMFVAAMRGGDVVPGYFYVSYVFDFKNPIGQSWVYRRSLATTFGQLQPTLPNRSIVLLEQTSNLGPGTILDMENNEFFYQGSRILLTPSVAVQLFENGQKSTVGSAIIDLSSWTLGGSGEYMGSFNPSSSTIQVYVASQTGARIPSLYYINSGPTGQLGSLSKVIANQVTFLTTGYQIILPKVSVGLVYVNTYADLESSRAGTSTYGENEEEKLTRTQGNGLATHYLAHGNSKTRLNQLPELRVCADRP